MESQSPLDSIDVTIATKNSARTIARCLAAIKKGIPYRRLIVVDGGSADGTIELARQAGAEVYIEEGPLGLVRHRQGELAAGEWLAIIDSDVYIYPNWWPNVRSRVGDDVGMILGSVRYSAPTFRKYEEYLNWHIRKFGGTAFTNTLVRRRLLVGCSELLQGVHAGEDAIFVKYMEQAGMKKVFIQKELFFHDQDTMRRDPYTYLREGASIRKKYGGKGVIHVVERPYEKTKDWIHFSLEDKSVSLKLLAYVLKLSGFVAVGFMIGHVSEV